jgi:hypothetical protein
LFIQTEKWRRPVLPLSRNKDKRIVGFGGLPNLGQPHLEFANENTRRFQKTRATEQCPKSMMFDADGVFSNLSKYPKDIVTLVLANVDLWVLTRAGAEV